MNKPPPADGGRWLVLIASLPTEDPAARMRMLRTLESLGAAVMREGAYLLPDTPSCRNGLEHLTEYIAKGAGTAQLLEVNPLSDAQQHTFRGLFDRSARYSELIKVVESMKVGFGIADPSAISRVLNKQRREFEAIGALDFFPSEIQERAKATLAAAEALVHKLMFPAQTQAGAVPNEPLQRRIWATRRPLWADRLACAWLIRRFVDPEGTIVWLEKTQEVHPKAVGFAFDGARFGNNASQVTFEVMLRQFGLAKNVALAKIGGIVHFLEVRDAPVPEAAGVQTLLQGAARRSGNDDELLAEVEKTFDLLYEAYFEAPHN
ncbi:MAG TPA: chromate resistance protein ChrB domain-containing protein [Burkholderiales bacterium]|nr:chromate resistance protein ChrB domain-containing protein [Burkholderiales bacterium]